LIDINQIKEVREKPASSKTVYYKFEMPVDPTPTDYYGYTAYATEYNGFLICRTNDEYLLWEIKTMDLKAPPVPLRTLATTQQRAKDYIDQFLAREEAAQKEKE
jgi:hypothetical protein